jgi:hypothetical protein
MPSPYWLILLGYFRASVSRGWRVVSRPMRILSLAGLTGLFILIGPTQSDDARLTPGCEKRQADLLEWMERTLPLPHPSKFDEFERQIRRAVALVNAECMRDECSSDVRLCARARQFEDVANRLSRR